MIDNTDKNNTQSTYDVDNSRRVNKIIIIII